MLALQLVEALTSDAAVRHRALNPLLALLILGGPLANNDSFEEATLATSMACESGANWTMSGTTINVAIPRTEWERTSPLRRGWSSSSTTPALRPSCVSSRPGTIAAIALGQGLFAEVVDDGALIPGATPADTVLHRSRVLSTRLLVFRTTDLEIGMSEDPTIDSAHHQLRRVNGERELGGGIWLVVGRAPGRDSSTSRGCWKLIVTVGEPKFSSSGLEGRERAWSGWAACV